MAVRVHTYLSKLVPSSHIFHINFKESKDNKKLTICYT